VHESDLSLIHIIVWQGLGFQVAHVARECLGMWGSPIENLPPSLVANFTCGVEAADPRSRLLVSPTPHTPSPKLALLHSTPCTLLSLTLLAPPRAPHTLNPAPYTLNTLFVPRREPWNPKPCTLHPTPYAVPCKSYTSPLPPPLPPPPHHHQALDRPPAVALIVSTYWYYPQRPSLVDAWAPVLRAVAPVKS